MPEEIEQEVWKRVDVGPYKTYSGFMSECNGVGRYSVSNGLKIRVSVVQFRPLATIFSNTYKCPPKLSCQYSCYREGTDKGSPPYSDIDSICPLRQLCLPPSRDSLVIPGVGILHLETRATRHRAAMLQALAEV